MSEPTHFEKVADYVMSNDGSELSMVKAERDYALHCLERELAIGEQDRARVEQLEAALREAEQFIAYLANETDGVFVGSGTPTTCLVTIRAALDQSSPIPEKPGVNAV